MTFGNKTIAGTLLFVSGAIYVLGVGIGEHYSNQTVLSASIALSGLLVIAGAIFIQRAFKSMPFTTLLILGGIGGIGISLLTLNSNEYLALAWISYISSGLAAIMSYKFAKSPVSYIFALLGALTLIMFALWAYGATPPSVIDNLILPWSIGFGAHIIGNSDSTSKQDKP